MLPRATGVVVPSTSSPTAPARCGEERNLMTFRAVPSTITSPYVSVAPPVLADVPASERDPVPTVMTLQKGPLSVIGAGSAGGYEGDLIGRIQQYAERCVQMIRHERFDVVHAHDWVTFPAGMAIAAQFGKPLVVHVHSTEFDRSGERVNQPVYDIERQGMHAAQTVLAVSHLTRRIIVERYGVAPEKVRVVHNGIDMARSNGLHHANGRAGGQKTVLFLGRLTRQKGASFFVQAAAKVLARQNNVRFLIAGWGDLGPQTITQVAALGLGRHIRFTGFLQGAEVEQAYRMADVYVMPSVSEPFGLTALEAIRHGVPVILSKNSGVAEVLPHGALKVDFWDVDRMADQIQAVLNHPELGEALRRSAGSEIRTLTWDAAARKCCEVYAEQMELCPN